MAETKPAVLVISSHVARGYVGNRAAVHTLETLAFPVWAIPTIQLPWHPGHGPATRMVTDETSFTNFLSDIASAPWIGEVGAILTGYMANPAQAEAVSRLIRKLRTTSPALLYLCDPVIGDREGLYVSEDIATTIRDQLLPLCGIATPNRFELAWLTDNSPALTMDETIIQARSLGPSEILVTSSHGARNEETGCLLVTEEKALLASHPLVADPPNGPGDLTAALYLGHRLMGLPAKDNLETTTASVFEILRQSVQQGSSELTLVDDSQNLTSPRARITATEITENNP